MTVEEAQKALDDFWEEVERKYAPYRSRLDDKDRQTLLRLETQYSETKKSGAMNN